MSRGASSADRFRLMLLVVAVSGMCSLIYQVAWFRLLKQIFGASTAASAAVMAIFMGGLGVGGHIFGRRTLTMKTPLRFYAGLELGIAVSAALSPFLVEVARAAYLETGGVFALGPVLGTVLRLLLAVLVLGLPTVLMGGTLPVVAQALERSRDLGRRRAAWLYGINTLGAVSGAAAANFVLIESFGIRLTLWLGAAMNIALAATAAWAARRAVMPEQDAKAMVEPDGEPDQEPGRRADEPAEPSVLGRGALSLLAAWVGCAFLLMELVWFRMLGPILGGSTFTMGLILAVALAGIGIGGLLYASAGESTRPTVRTLAWTCALEALCLAVPFWAGDSIALFAGHSRQLSAFGFHGLVLSWTLVASAVVLPASIVAGYQFPVLIGLLGSGRDGAGRDVGVVYAWNTAGAIVGSLGGGLLAIPAFGARAVWQGTTFGLVLAALALSLSSGRRGKSRGRRPRGAVAASTCGLFSVLLIGLADGPTAFWRHEPIGAGRMTTELLKTQNQYEKYRRYCAWSVRSETDGLESSIALVSTDDSALIVNGKSDGATLGDAPTTLMSGLIGAVLHGDPKETLVIGLGIGTTAGWFGTVDSVERVDVAELEPAVVETTRVLGPATFHVLDSPKTQLHLGDGRELVLTQDRTWDLIFSEPSNPYRAGVADLFSQDFYRAAESRLAPGGLFLQWLQAYEIEPALIQTVLATMSQEFGAVEVWLVGLADLVLVASREPIVHDFERTARLLELPAYAEGLRLAWNVSGTAGFYSGFLAGPALARALQPGVEPSTDDRPILELGFARSVGRDFPSPVPELRDAARELDAAYPDGMPESMRPEVDSAYRLRYFTDTAPGPARFDAETLTTRERAAWHMSLGRIDDALTVWRGDEPPAEHYTEEVFLAYGLASRGSAEARPWIDKVRSRSPLDADLLEALLLLRRGSVEPATELLRRSLDRLRESPWMHPFLRDKLASWIREGAATGPTAAATLFDATAGAPLAGYLLERQRQLLLLGLLSEPGLESRCVGYFSALEPHVWWRRDFLQARASCYETYDHPAKERARRQLERYIVQGDLETPLPDPAQSPPSRHLEKSSRMC